MPWLHAALILVFLPGILRAGEPSPAKQLRDLFAAEWEWELKTNPTRASTLGFPGYDHLWPDLSLQAFAEQMRHRQEVLQKLARIDIRKLPAEERINYSLFKQGYELAIAGFPHGWYLLPLDHLRGIQDQNPLIDTLRFRDLQDYQNWLIRLRSFPKCVDQTIALMKEGMRRGRVHPKVVMQRVPRQIGKQLVDDPERSQFFKPFKRFPETLTPAQRDQLTQEASKAIREQIVPAYRKLLDFFEKEYLPACPDQVGVWQMPGGQELYAFLVRYHTTTKLTPKEIHHIGIKEVQRIRGEMAEVIKQTGFKGTFAEFIEDLRTNPKFYYSKPEDLLAACKKVCDDIQPQLPRLFGRLPQTRLLVDAIPAHVAPDTTTAYYQPPSHDGRRPGTYYVNLYRLETRPKYEVEALSIHEAIPGHHLQIALAMEQKNLPNFRRFDEGVGSYTVFVEGWALYTESLGPALGMYRDPYSKFGQLSYQMWRACRLVVDTGMHSLKWTRKQAIDFMAENTALSRLNIENEIDRYITWPGQALAYKIGELKIKELRARAEQRLGQAFDVRAFHDVVLGSGAVPLQVLEENVMAWLEKTAK